MADSWKCLHCGNWIGPMQVHTDCARRQDEKRRKRLGDPYFETGCRCVIIANDDTAGTYCPVHGDQR